ncbi:NAD(+) diphosphatase [Chitinilyticum piscinae]|uniref:NAD(+) diphosphatase n=1 Tax=Chitinilyticum piscinae TaxID=2866724 RepID=A0A8J7FEK2_9NEIS|nr:NAD(+) diphosphatase [Chitinilyticum piscinae]MBE9607968.1 NAD(+) diphosphatase [Chitinilyticum piscinae]
MHSPTLPDDFTASFHALPAPLPAALSVAFRAGELLLAGTALPEQQPWPTGTRAWLIGHWQDQPVQLLALPDATSPDSLTPISLRASWALLPAGQYGIAARGRQLLHFLDEHRFCGACGHETALMAADEAAVACPACGQRAWPRHSPAVMVLVRRGSEILLARSPHFIPGVYGLIAGFVDAGETLEAAAVREVREEVGLEITNLRWFGSQSWPYPHSLMLAFTADYVSGNIVCQPGEIEDAGWYHIDALPHIPSGASLAYRLITSVTQQIKAGD